MLHGLVAVELSTSSCYLAAPLPSPTDMYSFAELLKEFEFLATKQLDKDSEEINAVVSSYVH